MQASTMKTLEGPTFLERIVLGTAGLGGAWRPIDPAESVKAIVKALEAGINAIDTAPAYGNAELLTGAALREWTGKRPFLSTKVGKLRSFSAIGGQYDYTDDGMAVSVQQSLDQLGVDVIDLLLLHEPPQVAEREVERVVRQLQRFKHSGLAKMIGLGGNFPTCFLPYVEAGIFDVVMEFNRLNACNIDALSSTVALCRKLSIQYYAASPLNMGLLGRYYESFVHQTPDWLSPVYVAAAQRARHIAEEGGLLLSELALRFLLGLTGDARIVIGAVDLQELSETIRFLQAGPLPDAVHHSLLESLKNNSLHVSDRS